MSTLARTGLLMLAGLLAAGELPAQNLVAPSPVWAAGDPVGASRAPTPWAVGVPDSIRVRVGYRQWRGAAIGAGIGGALGVLAALLVPQIDCSDCGEQWSGGTRALYGGLIGAGAGGVLGFLTGLGSPKYAWVPAERRPR